MLLRLLHVKALSCTITSKSVSCHDNFAKLLAASVRAWLTSLPQQPIEASQKHERVLKVRTGPGRRQSSESCMDQLQARVHLYSSGQHSRLGDFMRILFQDEMSWHGIPDVRGVAFWRWDLKRTGSANRARVGCGFAPPDMRRPITLSGEGALKIRSLPSVPSNPVTPFGALKISSLQRCLQIWSPPSVPSKSPHCRGAFKSGHCGLQILSLPLVVHCTKSHAMCAIALRKSRLVANVYLSLCICLPSSILK